MRTAERGLKVIIADGECQLARQRRVRAEDAEKLKRGERVMQDALRRRRRDLHRRPFLHPAVGLPVADGEAQSRSAAHRSGGDGDRELRRLRAVRRGRACRGAVPVVLSGRGGAQSECVGPRCCIAVAHARHFDGSAAARARSVPSPLAGEGRGEGVRPAIAQPPPHPSPASGRGSSTESGRNDRRQEQHNAASHHPAHRGARRRRRRRAHQLDRRARRSS